MMTLDEAIVHAEDAAKEQDKLCKRYDDASGYTRSHNEDIRTSGAKSCEKCAAEHRQLAGWLKELKQYREGKLSVDDWILCSERMPEEREWIGTKQFGTTISEEVYVTFKTPDGQYFTRHLCFQNKKISSSDQSTIDVWFKGSIPIAWMPKPEPYRADKEKE